MKAEACEVEVVERYQEGSQTRGRWRRLYRAHMTAVEAGRIARELRDQHGGARITCPQFEVVALRHSFALKLIEPAEPRPFTLEEVTGAGELLRNTEIPPFETVIGVDPLLVDP